MLQRQLVASAPQPRHHHLLRVGAAVARARGVVVDGAKLEAEAAARLRAAASLRVGPGTVLLFPRGVPSRAAGGALPPASSASLIRVANASDVGMVEVNGVGFVTNASGLPTNRLAGKMHLAV